MRQTSGHMSSRSLINLWARPAFYWWGSPVTSTTCQNSSSSLFWSSFCFLFSQKLQVGDCFRGVSGLGGSQLYNLWLIARRQKRPNKRKSSHLFSILNKDGKAGDTARVCSSDLNGTSIKQIPSTAISARQWEAFPEQPFVFRPDSPQLSFQPSSCSPAPF